VRSQSGFFNEEPLGLLATTLQRLARAVGPAHALIGSNAAGTRGGAVLPLVQLLCLPRQNSRLPENGLL
jgi:hypothetical protein